jgi:hypothetical protein
MTAEDIRKIVRKLKDVPSLRQASDLPSLCQASIMQFCWQIITLPALPQAFSH